MADNSEILRALGRIEGQLTAVIASLVDHTSRMNRIDEDIEDVRAEVGRVKEKLSTLEKKQYAIVVVATIALNGIAIFVKKFF